jgi:hypothetical protein
MNSLYNISQDILRIFDAIETAEGEITEEQYDELCIKQDELKVKLDAYVKAVKEFQSNADFCKNEKKSINDRQNVYKNRVEKLKSAMLDAVIAFGEEGKTNKFIELPTCRLFTKASKSIEVNNHRLDILADAFYRLSSELVKSGILYTGEDVDLQGILDVINANVIAEQGEAYTPFTIDDLAQCELSITTTATIQDLLKNNEHIIKQFVDNPINTKIVADVNKDNCKFAIEKHDANFTIVKQVINQNLQIK